MNAPDRVRLQHMLDAAREVVEFAQGTTLADFQTNPMRLRAVMMSISILGEAATRVSEDFKIAHPEILWPQIGGMRNRLIHAYFDVDVERVWLTATQDIPRILPLLENLLD